MAQYSKEVLDLFMNPKNMGEIENPSSIGKVGNPVCGDVMWVFLKVDDNTDVIEDINHGGTFYQTEANRGFHCQLY